MNIKIIVATHKEYPMPDDPVYFPLQAGAAINPPLSYPGDNTGENISAKNKNFCELTALYWAWYTTGGTSPGRIPGKNFPGSSAALNLNPFSPVFL